MRRAFVLILLLAAGACHKAGFAPVVPSETRALDREVLDLVESKAALVRASPADAHAHATLGLVYEANEMWEEAAQSFANAIALDDSQPVWLFHRAIALRAAGQTEASMAAMREAAQRLPETPSVQQRLGEMLLQIGDVAGARAAIGVALARAPNQAECLTDMADVELAAEHFDKALEYARGALAIDPSYQSASYAAGLAEQALGHDVEARAHLAAGIGARPRWLADPLTRELLSFRLTTSGLIEDASRANASGNYALAAQIYDRILARKPGDPDYLNNKAANLIEIGQLERAEACLRDAERSAPQSFAVQLNYAELYLRKPDLGLARAHAERAVELGASVGRTHFILARVMALQKDLAGAARELKKTVDLDARNAQCFSALAEVSFQLGKLEDARSACRKALEIDPGLLPARVNLGAFALRAGDLIEARKALAVLEQQAPDNPRTAALREEIQKREQ